MQHRHQDVYDNPQHNLQAQQVHIHFEYTGKTGLTVIGNITGTRYRFNNPGAVIPIDARDAPGMTGIPVLARK